MELQGRITIPASCHAVWQALNDPEILRRCIPGCEEVKQISPEEMHARVLLRMGPVRARFAGKVTMSEVRPLAGYTLHFEGSGGSAGFARGSSVITLTDVGAATELAYTADASVAGKLGQIGGRLIDASARQLADQFFANFQREVVADTQALPQVQVLPQAQNSAAAEVPGPAALAPMPSPTVRSEPAQPSWLSLEAPRLLWFSSGVIATGLGVWMGAHWLR
jgi:uncharacterized protein